MTTNTVKHASGLAWLVWGVATLYFFFDFINQILPGAIGGQLQQAFHSNAANLGFMADIYFYCYAVMQIPIGLMVDRFGPKRPLLFASLMAISGCVLLFYATSADQAILARAITGTGAAFSFVCCLKLAATWFPARWFATMVGITNIVGMLGAVTAGGVLVALAQPDYLGWRNTVLVVAGIGTVAAVLILLVVRDRPKNLSASALDQQKNIWQRLKELWSIPSLWLAGLYAATINTTYTVLGGLWGTPYLQQAFDISVVHAGAMTTLIFWGGIPGSFFFGWFSDVIYQRKLPLWLGAAGGLASFALLIYAPNLPIWAGYILLFLLGFFCSSNVVAYAYASDVGPKQSEGIGLGTINTCLIGGSTLFGPFIGWLLDRLGGSQPDLLNYQYALTAITVSLSISLLAAFAMRESLVKN